MNYRTLSDLEIVDEAERNRDPLVRELAYRLERAVLRGGMEKGRAPKEGGQHRARTMPLLDDVR